MDTTPPLIAWIQHHHHVKHQHLLSPPLEDRRGRGDDRRDGRGRGGGRIERGKRDRRGKEQR